VRGYCGDVDDLETTCAFHHAAVELRHSIVSVLARWTLKDLAAAPRPSGRLPEGMHCVTASPLVRPGTDKPPGLPKPMRGR
jgi:hypothetical protein